MGYPYLGFCTACFEKYPYRPHSAPLPLQTPYMSLTWGTFYTPTLDKLCGQRRYLNEGGLKAEGQSWRQSSQSLGHHDGSLARGYLGNYVKVIEGYNDITPNRVAQGSLEC